MAIYTKTGDRGKTKVFDKKNGKLVLISKSSFRIETIGAIDELNSLLGIIKTGEKGTDGKLLEIQKNLFAINSIIAGSSLVFTKAKTKRLEREIDVLEGALPVLKNFIIYGGATEASMLFYARALVRRAERAAVSLSEEEKINPNIMTYINRLSDYFFMLARFINFNNKVDEIIWKK